MPEVTSDERGRRAYMIQKERAVEGAIEKIRLSLGQDWMLFSIDDIELLHHLLGEAWVSMDRRTWGRCAFIRLTRPEIDQILAIGKAIGKGREPEKAVIAQVIEIVKKSQ